MKGRSCAARNDSMRPILRAKFSASSGKGALPITTNMPMPERMTASRSLGLYRILRSWVRRAKRGTVTSAELRRLREEFETAAAALQALVRRANQLEREVAALVNEAYGLSPDEIELLWRTAPPRMPIEPPPPAGDDPAPSPHGLHSIAVRAEH
jgi:hypothetical protein